MLSRQPLRRQVVAASAVLLLAVIGATVWAANETRLERRREITAQSAALAATVAGSLDQYLSAVYALAATLAQHPDVQTLDPGGAQRLFASVLAEQPFLSNIILGNRNAQIVATSQSAAPLPAPAPEFGLEALRSNRPVLSDLFLGIRQGVPMTVLAFPVHGRDGATAGLLGLVLDLPRMQEVFARIPLPKDSVVTVFDRNNRIVARSSDASKYVGQAGRPPLTEATASTQDLDGVNRLAADAMLQRAPWRVSVGIPLSEVVARGRASWARNFALVVTVVTISLGLLLWMTIGVSRGLEALRIGAKRIADGDLTRPPAVAMPNLELEQGQEMFAMMAAKLREARESHERHLDQERRLNELLQSMQRQVVRQERLAAVGQLVSGVAHEMNNPLQAILGASELLERHANLSSDARQEVEVVQSQAVRAREIIRSLSRFSDPRVGPAEPVDLREVVAAVLRVRDHDQRSEGTRVRVQAMTARRVSASFTELARVLLNLVFNAEQALRGADIASPSIEIHLMDHGARVRCEVHDNGPGVRPEDEPKLFQPFFTTRPVGDGSGLGLSMSYGIIHSYGGSIGHYRNAAGGATFFFELAVDRSDDDVQDGTSLLQPPIPSRV